MIDDAERARLDNISSVIRPPDRKTGLEVIKNRINQEELYRKHFNRRKIHICFNKNENIRRFNDELDFSALPCYLSSCLNLFRSPMLQMGFKTLN